MYKLKPTAAEVADLFRAQAQPGNVGEEVYPGRPGYVIEAGMLRAMAWGFPLKLKGMAKPKPVNNARTDKLDSFMWRYSFNERRCLIPLSAWAEAEGEKGSKTRTWLSLPDQPVFAAAGIWRDRDEWGPGYSMIMTEACELTACVHDRMPVILDPEMYEQWVSGPPADALAFCVPYAGRIEIDRTSEPWVRR